MKKCIFHMPMYIAENESSGSAVRPRSMIKAFQNIGYEVDIIMGYGKERKAQIKAVKDNIKRGIKYDFVYSESSTMPTLLTEKNHIPAYPFLDFGFFKFCQKKGLKIGLFYRDIYWRFPLYREGTSKWIPLITIPFYKYDLRKYKKLLNILYVPSGKFMEYADIDMNYKPLPSGGKCIKKSYSEHENNQAPELFYVGGVVGNNDITGLVEAIKELDKINLTICCNKSEWDQYKHLYDGIITDRVKIIHKSGEELEEYYSKADVACLYYKNNEYRDMAMPVKLFEYIGSGVPIVSNSGTVAADFIAENNIGWVIDYKKENIAELLKHLIDNRDEIIQRASNTAAIAAQNTWEKRAETVAEDLIVK